MHMMILTLQDTTGRSLEALDSLFQRPWYTVYQVAYADSEDIQIERLDKVELGTQTQHVE
jgi:hypothetical protein